MNRPAEMNVTMSNGSEYHVNQYSSECFADSDAQFLAIYGENTKFLSIEHILAVEVIFYDTEHE